MFDLPRRCASDDYLSLPWPTKHQIGENSAREILPRLMGKAAGFCQSIDELAFPIKMETPLRRLSTVAIA